LKAAAAVAGALVDGGNGLGAIVAHEVGEAQGEWLRYVAFDVETPLPEIYCARNAIEMPSNVESVVGRESGKIKMTRSFELNRAIGEKKKRRFLGFGSELTDGIPVRVCARTGERGKRLCCTGLLGKRGVRIERAGESEPASCGSGEAKPRATRRTEHFFRTMFQA
jgi:hypothetical protein